MNERLDKDVMMTVIPTWMDCSIVGLKSPYAQAEARPEKIFHDGYAYEKYQGYKCLGSLDYQSGTLAAQRANSQAMNDIFGLGGTVGMQQQRMRDRQ